MKPPGARCVLLQSLLAGSLVASPAVTQTLGSQELELENNRLRVSFDPASGLVSSVVNKLTAERIPLREEGFAVDAVEFSITPREARLESLRRVSPERIEAVYVATGSVVTCSYTLGRDHHFLEKTLAIRSAGAFAWKNVVISRLNLQQANLDLVKYPHQKMVT